MKKMSANASFNKKYHLHSVGNVFVCRRRVFCFRLVIRWPLSGAFVDTMEIFRHHFTCSCANESIDCICLPLWTPFILKHKKTYFILYFFDSCHKTHLPFIFKKKKQKFNNMFFIVFISNRTLHSFI